MRLYNEKDCPSTVVKSYEYNEYTNVFIVKFMNDAIAN